jgi:hypothetical protein
MVRVDHETGNIIVADPVDTRDISSLDATPMISDAAGMLISSNAS